jgi:hypothetical protein
VAPDIAREAMLTSEASSRAGRSCADVERDPQTKVAVTVSVAGSSASSWYTISQVMEVSRMVDAAVGNVRVLVRPVSVGMEQPVPVEEMNLILKPGLVV